MAASFPGSIKTFSTKSDGVDKVYASHVNDIQNEVTAIETELKKTTGSVVDHGALTGLGDNDHPQYVYKDGWVPVTGTWTYASATTIKVPSGAAAIYKVGQGLKLNNTDTKYFYIVAVADTLLTITGGSDYTLDSDAISAISYTNTPGTAIGFPVWFAWTPSSQTGWTDMPTGVYRFSIAEKTLFFLIDLSDSTSNATTAVLALPVMPARRFNNVNGFAVDNGTTLTVATRWFVETNGNIYFYTNMSAGVWTNSGIKRVRTNGFYEIG